MSVNSFCVRRRTNSSPNGRFPSLYMKFSLEEPIAFATLRIIVWNQSHGTTLGSKDSTHNFFRLFFSPSHPFFSLFRFLYDFYQCSDKPHTRGIYIIKCTYPMIPGGFFSQKPIMIIILEHQDHRIYVLSTHMFLVFAIICTYVT